MKERVNGVDNINGDCISLRFGGIGCWLLGTITMTNQVIECKPE